MSESSKDVVVLVFVATFCAVDELVIMLLLIAVGGGEIDNAVAVSVSSK